MRATIASSAAAKYAAKTKKRVTKDTLGGLIQILDFEIVATHLGARSERATILIKEFESIGSDGSGGFGSPRPLESLPEIVELLDQLKTLRARETHGSQLRSRLASPSEGSLANPQLGVEGFDADSPRASQLMFATQVPSRFPDMPLVVDGGAQRESGSGSARSKLKDTSDEIAAASFRQRQVQPLVNAKAKVNGKRSVNTSAGLLSMLAPKQVVKSPVPNLTTAKKHISAQLPEPREVSQDIRSELKNSLISEAAIGGVDLVTPSDHTQDVHEQVQGSEVAISRQLATQSISELPSPLEAFTEHSSAVNIGHSSKDNHRHSVSQPEKVANCAVVTPVPKVRGLYVKLVSMLSYAQSFKLIHSSDIRIPKDQELLLDRADCELPLLVAQ